MNEDKKVVPALRYLVVVRVGEYHEVENFLTSKGIRQLQVLGRKLVEKFSSMSIAMLCADTPPARESVEILKNILNVPFEEHACLHTKVGHILTTKAAEAVELVDARGITNQVVILVTHGDYVGYFPRIWGKEHDLLRIGNFLNFPRGAARVVDIQEGYSSNVIPFV